MHPASRAPEKPAAIRCTRTLGVLLLLLSPLAVASPPRVTVSIQPVHSLVAGIMQGVAEPRLLVAGGASPHGYQMRPSDAAALYSADLVFWMGVPLETFLQSALANVRPPARIVTLLDTPGLALLANRERGVWRAGRASVSRVPKPAMGKGGRDPHVWLSPDNAGRLVNHVATVLSGADPPNAAKYGSNAAALIARIEALNTDISSRLAPFRDVSFIMFHDAFQYFESAFRLNAAGTLYLEPDRPPGAKQLVELRAVVRARGVRCVFREPQFHAALVDTLTEGTDASEGVLDPLGAGIPPGPEAWFQMMRTNADAMAACLGR